MDQPPKSAAGRFTSRLSDPPTIAVALEADDVSVVDDTIDQGGDRGGIGEDRRPVAERQVCGEDQTLLFLINEASFGRFFEVTDQGETVWEYVNPYFGGPPSAQTNAVFRAFRYTPEEISAAKVRGVT